MSIYISSKFYPNNASENALASKSCKSSIFSPTPINLTGTSTSDLTASTTPPLAVPSNLVKTIPVISQTCLKLFACDYWFSLLCLFPDCSWNDSS